MKKGKLPPVFLLKGRESLGKKEFAKKFQLKSNIVEKLNRIYFKIEKNINTGSISIFDVKISQLNQQDEKQIKKRYSIRNSQELKSLVKQIING